MELSTLSVPAPFSTDEHGVVRVGGTRVTLDQVILPFLAGVTPEEIAIRYSSLALAEVYGTITYYLRHRADVDQYLAAEASGADEARTEYAEALDVNELRSRLLARQRV